MKRNDSVLTGTIENWFPHRGKIIGTVSGDTKKRFTDGQSIITSKVMAFTSDPVNGKCVKTFYSYYKLGKRAK